MPETTEAQAVPTVSAPVATKPAKIAHVTTEPAPVAETPIAAPRPKTFIEQRVESFKEQYLQQLEKLSPQGKLTFLQGLLDNPRDEEHVLAVTDEQIELDYHAALDEQAEDRKKHFTSQVEARKPQGESAEVIA